MSDVIYERGLIPSPPFEEVSALIITLVQNFVNFIDLRRQGGTQRLTFFAKVNTKLTDAFHVQHWKVEKTVGPSSLSLSLSFSLTLSGFSTYSSMLSFPPFRHDFIYTTFKSLEFSSLSLSHTFFLLYSLSLSHTHTYSLFLSFSLPHSFSLSQSSSLTNSLSYSVLFTFTHTLYFLSFYLSISLSYSVSLTLFFHSNTHSLSFSSSS